MSRRQPLVSTSAARIISIGFLLVAATVLAANHFLLFPGKSFQSAESPSRSLSSGSVAHNAPEPEILLQQPQARPINPAAAKTSKPGPSKAHPARHTASTVVKPSAAKPSSPKPSVAKSTVAKHAPSPAVQPAAVKKQPAFSLLEASTPAPGCNAVFDMYWLIDGSGSVTPYWSTQIAFASKVTTELDVQPGMVQVGVVQFRGPAPGVSQPAANIELILNDDKQFVQHKLAAMDQLEYGWTRTDLGIEIVQQLLDAGPPRRPEVPAVIMIVTDGLPEDGYLSPPCMAIKGCMRVQDWTITAANQAKAQGTVIGAVTVGRLIGVERAAQWVSDPSLLWHVDGFSDLDALAANVTEMLCKNLPDVTPVATPTPTPVLTPTPSRGPTNPIQCAQQLNVFVVLDGSGSIGDQFPYELNFASEVVAGINVTGAGIHAGVIQFRGEAKTPTPENPPVRLEQPLSGDSAMVVDSIANISRLQDGWTRTDLAVQQAASQLLGYRSGTPNVIILVTDGLPEDGYLNPPCQVIYNCTVVETYTMLAIGQAKAYGIQFIAVGVGPLIDYNTLQLYASHDYVFTVTAFSNLFSIVDDLTKLVCEDIPDLFTPTPLPTATPFDPFETESPSPDIEPSITPQPGQIVCPDGSLSPPDGQCPPCYNLLDIFWVLDGSGSVGNQWPLELSFGQQVSAGLNITADGIHVGIIQFRGEAPNNTAVVEELALTSDAAEVADTFPQIERLADGWTRTDLAINEAQAALEEQGRPDIPNVMILVTDGLPEDGYLNTSCMVIKGCTLVNTWTVLAADQAKAKGTTIIAVGVGPLVKYARLVTYASSPKYVFQTNSFTQISELLNNLTRVVCEIPQPTPSAEPEESPSPSPELCPDGFPPSPDGICPEISPTPPLDCFGQIDVVFALDGSGSIGNQFSYETTFTENVIRAVNVSADGVNVGVVQFRGEAKFPSPDNPPVRVEMPISGDEGELVRGVARIEQLKDGWTRSDLALQKATDMLLNSRPGIPDMIILITDGLPEDGYLIPPCYSGRCNTINSFTVSAAQVANSSGILVVVVGVGPLVRYYRLVEYASSPKLVFTTKDWTTISELIGTIASIVCVSPTPSPTPSPSEEPMPTETLLPIPSETLIPIPTEFFPTTEPIPTMEPIPTSEPIPTPPPLPTDIICPDGSLPLIDGTCPSESPTPDVICAKALNLMWVLDGSGSVGYQFWYELRFGKLVSEGLNVSAAQVNAGILQFRGNTRVELPITDIKDALLKRFGAIERLETGWTRTDLAFTQAQNNLLSHPRTAPNVMVVVTDGLPEDGDFNPPCLAAQGCTTFYDAAVVDSRNVQEAGTTVIMVGVGPLVNYQRLVGLASGPQYVLMIDSWKNTTSLIQNLTTVICSDGSQGGADTQDLCPDGSVVPESGLCPTFTPTPSSGPPSPTSTPSASWVVGWFKCPIQPDYGVYPTKCPPVKQGENVPCEATGLYPDWHGLYPNDDGKYPDWQGCYPNACGQYPGFYSGSKASYPACEADPQSVSANRVGDWQ